MGKHFNADVYNFGLSGSGTDQQYLIWKEYAQGVEVDLIVLGVLVENIERNKFAFRETLHPHTKKRILTPKPYFKLEGKKLKLHNCPTPKSRTNLAEDNLDKILWSIPKKEE